MLATHNSGTGYDVVWPWWAHGPVNWWAACQSLTLEQQWDAGTRFFDFRVRIGHTTDEIVVCHGLVEYNLTLDSALATIAELSTTAPAGDVYILIRHDRTCDQDDLDAVSDAYNKYRLQYPTLKFTGLTDAQEGYTIIAGDVSRPCTREMHGSVDSGWKVYWPPYLWALLYNKDEYSTYLDYVDSTSKYLMLDFIEIDD